jgi:hypothetical protein
VPGIRAIHLRIPLAVGVALALGACTAATRTPEPGPVATGTT